MGAANVINIPELIDRLDNDFELFVELVELFEDDSSALLDKIEAAINSREHEILRKAAHTLKGAVANFSAPAAFEAASTLEQTGKNMDLEGAEEQFCTLKSETEAVLSEMKRLIAKGSF
jgi:HPt (histidine-containing phosphotransfer) domain-containing protein